MLIYCIWTAIEKDCMISLLGCGVYWCHCCRLGYLEMEAWIDRGAVQPEFRSNHLFCVPLTRAFLTPPLTNKTDPNAPHLIFNHVKNTVFLKRFSQDRFWTLNRQFQKIIFCRKQYDNIRSASSLADVWLHCLHASHHCTSTQQQMEKPDKIIVQISVQSINTRTIGSQSGSCSLYKVNTEERVFSYSYSGLKQGKY